MKLDESGLNCQIPTVQIIAERSADLPPQSISRRIKLAIRRRLSPGRERALKTFTNHWINRLAKFSRLGAKPEFELSGRELPVIQVGDLVRVCSLDEIQGTLNHWRQLKGCSFMPEMAQFCGSTQRVLKPLLRFVDERDLRVKRSSGIFLLEGVICQGTSDFGPCDRSCFYFWREEWLEKIDQAS